MHKNVNSGEKLKKNFLGILFFKNFKNAACDALLQGFVNKIQYSIVFYLWNCRRREIFRMAPKKPVFHM